MEKRFMIALKSTEEVRKFLEDVMPLKGEYDLISGKYIVDAKSILGIYSLNLSKPLELVAQNYSDDELAVIEKYVINKAPD
jgi:hypothetical protein